MTSPKDQARSSNDWLVVVGGILIGTGSYLEPWRPAKYFLMSLGCLPIALHQIVLMRQVQRRQSAVLPEPYRKAISNSILVAWILIAAYAIVGSLLSLILPIEMLKPLVNVFSSVAVGTILSFFLLQMLHYLVYPS